mmetsp:Transcript_21033/g.45555  ORF Transcript_21033/g.45555 Transcript_21033/m.45555 type:complete len:88 (+) Transcript_21033:1070-1333(+)
MGVRASFSGVATGLVDGVLSPALGEPFFLAVPAEARASDNSKGTAMVLVTTRIPRNVQDCVQLDTRITGPRFLSGRSKDATRVKVEA